MTGSWMSIRIRSGRCLAASGERLLAVLGLDHLVAGARRADRAGSADCPPGPRPPECACSCCASPVVRPSTGSVTEKVEPCPGRDSTQILPPCISTMRLRDRQARGRCRPSSWWPSCRPAGTPRRSWPGRPRRCPDRCRAPTSVNEPLAADALIVTSPVIGELDRVADEIEQHLGEAALVAVRRRQVGRHLDLERELLLGGERLDRAEHAVHHVLDRIVGERERELAGLDLRQVEHVVDQAEQMLAVASARARARRASSPASRRRCRRGSARCSRGWR